MSQGLAGRRPIDVVLVRECGRPLTENILQSLLYGTVVRSLRRSTGSHRVPHWRPGGHLSNPGCNRIAAVARPMGHDH